MSRVAEQVFNLMKLKGHLGPVQRSGRQHGLIASKARAGTGAEALDGT
jgi:hypothetical protein